MRPEGKESVKLVPKDVTADEWQELFEQLFWNLYPHKVGKFEARKSWQRIRPWSQDTCDEVFAGLDRWNLYWNEQETDKRFIPYPATWLNQHRWEDEP